MSDSIYFTNTPSTYDDPEPPIHTFFNGKPLMGFHIGGRSHSVPKLHLDTILQQAYNSTLSSNLAMSDEHFNLGLLEIKSNVTLSGLKVGVSRGLALTINLVTCRKTFRELLEIATNCQSEETANSSPSIILHQICSLAILFSLPQNYKVVFEDSSVAGQPDLTVSGEHSFSIEISTSKQFSQKSSKYHGPLVLIDKYSFASLIPQSEYLSFLTQLSSTIDSRETGLIDAIIRKQNIKNRELIYDEEILSFLLNTPEQILDRLSRKATKAIQNNLKPSHEEEVLFNLDFTQYGSKSNFDWLCFDIMGRDSESPVHPIEDFEVVDDELRIRGEETVSSSYFEKVNEIFMDYRSLRIAQSYRQSYEWRTAAELDLYYHKEIVSRLNPRGSSYYKQGGSAKLNTERELLIKEPKAVEGISFIIPVYPEHGTCESISSTLRNKISCGIDPADLELLKDSPRELINWFKMSKIYQILRLFSKGAQAILSSARDISGRRFRFHSKWSSMTLHMYVAGNPVELDKGVVYISLLSEGILRKTWVWRSTDLKHFTRASTVLVTTAAGMFSEVIGRKLAALDVYSLLIFENSWGASKILKVYRYFAMGFLYKSPLLGKQVTKLTKAIKENEPMVRRKMSLTLLFELLKSPAEGTPAFGFDKSTLGYEIFLVNLCPSDTYGSRKHRVDVTKEFVAEMKLWESKKSRTLEHWNMFKYLIRAVEEGDESMEKPILQSMASDLAKLSLENSGRFTICPLGLLSVWGPISKLKTNFSGTCPKITELMTMKASFDPLRFLRCSALESITFLSSKESAPTTASLAISVLSRVIDLTFRMFDKAQVGGNREISILSSEYRVIQSITESFSKRLGKSTGIDMLDNPQKVELLSEAHNECDTGLRLTADQTRWGPNFNTSIFGYMFALFSRRTTEHFIPMMTCFLGELKIFEALPYSELWESQEDGYTLPGIFGQSHMGQGIYHYTSSLWHSLVHKVWNDINSLVLDSCSMRIKSFCTSDDIAQFLIVQKKENESPTEEDLATIESHSKRVLSHYASFLQFYSVLTSDYKNMISNESVEFNSIFLNKNSVGSNSLKFLYSLVDPYTSGNKLRDINNIWDTYADGINSGLSESNSLLLSLAVLKMRLFQWGESSSSVRRLMRLAREMCRDRSTISELPILLTSKAIGETFEDTPNCPTVLPFRKYADSIKGLEMYKSMLREEFEISKIVLKEETLAKAKARRLSSNRGLILSKKLRDISVINLPIDNRLNALFCSSSAYLAYTIKNGGPLGLSSISHSYVQAPFSTRREVKPGIHMKVLRSSRMSRASLDQLVVSSYERVNFLSSESTDQEIYLHLTRKQHNIRMTLSKEIEKKSMGERLLYFDELIAQARITGSAKQLKYFPEVEEYQSYQFEDISGIISYFPLRELYFPGEDLIGKESDFPTIYAMRLGKKFLNSRQSGKRSNVLSYSSRSFSFDTEDLIRAAQSMVSTEKTYASSSGRSSMMYLNIQVTKRVSYSEGEEIVELINPFENESMSDYLLRLLEDAGLNVDEEEPAEEMNDNDEFSFLSRANFSLQNNTISFPIKQHVSILSEPWFQEEMIANAALGRMIEDGFVQSLVPLDHYLAWSISTGYRTNTLRSRVPFANVNPEYSMYLTSLFDIKREMRAIVRDTYLPLSAATTERVFKIISASRDIKTLELGAIGSLPLGMTISSMPQGVLIDVSKIKTIQELSEHVRFAPTTDFSEPSSSFLTTDLY